MSFGWTIFSYLLIFAVYLVVCLIIYLMEETWFSHIFQDEKDKRIRELSLELYNERQKYKRRCAAYDAQVNAILNDLEKHTEHISNKVAHVVQSIREVEEQLEKSDSEWS